jgi:hypothetical protein
VAHRSTVGAGEHQHYFYNAAATLPVAVGDTLFAYVYLDPANPPSEVMLQWWDGSSDDWHRAYWGANFIAFGTDGTVYRRFMGALPATGQWVRLSVPASQLGLEGKTLSGMAYTLYGGRATWDYAGKSSGGGTPPASLVNPSFEIPALSGGYQYNPSATGIGWTFSANSGIQGNGSAWGAAPAPNGVQTAFIQGTSTITQTLSLNAGSYTLSFQAARRSCCVAPYVQPIKVTIDGAQIGGLVSPASTSFSIFSIPFSVATTGAHTIVFTGTDANDKTTFIDSVTIQ